PDAPYTVAFGTALQALGDSEQQISLLPSDYRAGWEKRLTRQRIEMASMALAMICVVALIMGSWQKLSLIRKKEALLAKVHAAQQTVQANDNLVMELVSEYRNLQPLFLRQQSTVDTLKTLSLLDQVRSNRPFWFVLIADQGSYFSHTPASLSTNRLARTNQPAPALAPPGISILAEGPRTPWTASTTNLALAKPGLIAELSVPGDPESTRHILSGLVSTLKQESLFSKVDLLSEDLRRSLADPKVTLSDRHFAIALDFSETELHQPVRWKQFVSPVSRSDNPRRNGSVPGNSEGKGYRPIP
ncbi:MAG TPA: hypothetical protein VN673_08835, partial [Clostridia bacterium]|nr:hypothetical protein [Clostridia bacterium]